jgi:hypothetical protein
LTDDFGGVDPNDQVNDDNQVDNDDDGENGEN